MAKKPTESKWPADEIELRPVADLVPYARNARTHSPEQVAQVAASIREWGWTTPILLDEENMIIAGHGRVLAAQKLALANVPVMVARGWSEAQKRAYVIADNQLAMNAGWSEELLRVELEDLRNDGFDLGMIGFSDAELAHLARIGETPVAQETKVKDNVGDGRFGLLIEVENETVLEALYNELQEQGYECKVMS